MKKEGKTNYEAPSTTVVAVKTGGVVCLSPGAGVQNYNWNEYTEE